MSDQPGFSEAEQDIKRKETRREVFLASRAVKPQFGYVKVRYRGLAKNTAQLHSLFPLVSLFIARRALMNMG